MTFTPRALLLAFPLAGIAAADHPFENANYGAHMSGPEGEADAFEGKGVLLEYFGFH